MKLKVVMTGVTEATKDVTIRNPSATLVNLRAAIAVHFKTDPHRFRMVHSTVCMDDETRLLSASGIRDGDTITLVAKRDREESDDRASGEPEAIHSAASLSGTTAGPAGDARASASLSISQIMDAMGLASNRSSLAGLESGRSTGVASTVAAGVREPGAGSSRVQSQRSTLNSNRSTNARHTAPHGIEDESISLDFMRQGDHDDDEDDSDVEEEDDAEESDEESDGEAEEEDPVAAEQHELVQLLLDTPNVVALRDQFLQSPEAMLAQIQANNPRLFQLIASHAQFFLELVQNEDLLAALREEAESADEHYLYEEGEEDEEDEEESEMLTNMLLQALQHQSAARTARDNRNRSSDEDVPSLVPSGRSTTTETVSRRTVPLDGVGGGPSGSSASAAIVSSTPIPATISPEDQEKIESLMQLGFTREQCTAAFFRTNRSLDRAANMLFENPPSI